MGSRVLFVALVACVFALAAGATYVPTPPLIPMPWTSSVFVEYPSMPTQNYVGKMMTNEDGSVMRMDEQGTGVAAINFHVAKEKMWWRETSTLGVTLRCSNVVSPFTFFTTQLLQNTTYVGEDVVNGYDVQKWEGYVDGAPFYLYTTHILNFKVEEITIPIQIRATHFGLETIYTFFGFTSSAKVEADKFVLPPTCADMHAEITGKAKPAPPPAISPLPLMPELQAVKEKLAARGL